MSKTMTEQKAKQVISWLKPLIPEGMKLTVFYEWNEKMKTWVFGYNRTGRDGNKSAIWTIDDENPKKVWIVERFKQQMKQAQENEAKEYD